MGVHYSRGQKPYPKQNSGFVNFTQAAFLAPTGGNFVILVFGPLKRSSFYISRAKCERFTKNALRGRTLEANQRKMFSCHFSSMKSV